MRAALFTIAIVIAACGTSTTIPDGGSPADGGGVCCAFTGSTPCGCAGGGGWAPSVDQCPKGGTCDEWFDTTTDSHGCAALVANPSKCCGCPPPKDSGSDVVGDVANDVTSE